MFGSEVLEVVIGVVVVYLLLSMMSSAIMEIISARLKLRSRDLEDGIRSLFNAAPHKRNDNFLKITAWLFTGKTKYGLPIVTQDAAGNFFEHPLIQGLAPPGIRLPSYIPSRIFAAALFDVIVSERTLDDVRESVRGVPRVRQILSANAHDLAIMRSDNLRRQIDFVLPEGTLRESLTRLLTGSETLSQGDIQALKRRLDELPGDQLLLQLDSLLLQSSRQNVEALLNRLPDPDKREMWKLLPEEGAELSLDDLKKLAKKAEELLAGAVKDEFLAILTPPTVRHIRDVLEKAEPEGLVPQDQMEAARLAHLRDLLLPTAVPLQEEAKVKAMMDWTARPGGDVNLKSTLGALLGRSDVQGARPEIERWFDDGMDRVSGIYKRNTHKILLGLALALIVFLNADTLSITLSLWRNDVLREEFVARAEDLTAGTTDASASEPPADSEAEFIRLREQLTGLQVLGWEQKSEEDCNDEPEPFETGPDLRAVPFCLQSAFPFAHDLNPWRLMWKAIGLLLTWFAVSQGAPFWFDILKRLVNVRSTGKEPEKTTGNVSPSGGNVAR